MNSAAVYTAITGAYDRLQEQPAAARADADFVAFVDQETYELSLSQTSWALRQVHHHEADHARTARYHKMYPHELFPEKEYSLWMDGRVVLTYAHSTTELIERYLRDVDLCVFRHAVRHCVYEEAAACLRRKLDDPALITRQIERYRLDGLPPQSGLIESTVVLRRHTTAVNRFGEAWWHEITTGSKRDQLSFNYLARKMNLRFDYFPLSLRQENGLFMRRALKWRYREARELENARWAAAHGDQTSAGDSTGA